MTRADAVFSAWRIPLAVTRHVQTLRAAAVSLEARVTFLPGAYAAARAEHLTFGQVSTGAETLPWDAPVTRLEVGAGYYLQRNLVARASIQFNDRHERRDTGARLAAAQLLFWF